MALQYSTGMRTYLGQAIDYNSAPTFTIYSGAVPANTSAAPAGSVLVSFVLPTDWIDNSSPVFSKLGTWSGTASATGTMTFFRISKTGTVWMQGTVGTSGTDMIVSNAAITNGQAFTVLSFNITIGNA